MVDWKKYIIGFLILLVSTTTIYISLQDKVRLRVDDDKSTFYVKNENNRWIVSGREYNKLFDGTSGMNRRVSGIERDIVIDNVSNTVTITRKTPYIRGPTIIDTYYFDGKLDDVERFPINHKVVIINGSGFFYRYEVKDLRYDGETYKLEGETELSFGLNMEVHLNSDYRWGWVYKSGILKAQYDIKSDYEVLNFRLFDPEEPPEIGYEFLDEGEVIHIWNTQDDYYFDNDSGIQFTNHYENYWTINVFCVGYYSGDTWNKIKCADELTNFSRNIQTDNETYINITLWKGFTYNDYDMRLGVQYHLGLNDKKLSITVYGKNLGIDIPFDLGFAWKIKDIEIPPNMDGDSIEINNTRYSFNEPLDLLFKNMSQTYLDGELNGTAVKYDSHFRMQDITKFLKVDWDKDLNYAVKLYSNGTQDSAFVSLLINAGQFAPQQEKSTTFYWIDAEGDYVTNWPLGGGQTSINGLTTDGTNIFAIQYTSGLIWKYDMYGNYITNLTLTAGNVNEIGMTTDGTNIWVSDLTDKEIYKYYMNGTHITNWAVDAGNTDSRSLANNDTHIWSLDNAGDKAYLYYMNGTYITNWALNVNNVDSLGMTTDGTNIWVSDTTAEDAFKYYMNGTYITNWSLHVDNNAPYGMGNNETHLFVGNNAPGTGVYVYQISDKTLPRYYYNSTNNTLPISGEVVKFDINWTDDLGLSLNFLETNISGSAKNYTTTLSGTSQNVNITNVTSSTWGCYYWKSFTNDTSGNWNQTNKLLLLVTNYLIGNVTDSNGLAIENALVTVALNNSITNLWGTVTNSTGRWLIKNISKGYYTICSYKPTNETLRGDCTLFVSV